MRERRRRSVVKSVSWRFLATATTVLLVFLFTGRVETAVSVGAVEMVAKLVIFYAHERLWATVPWGFERAAS